MYEKLQNVKILSYEMLETILMRLNSPMLF